MDAIRQELKELRSRLLDLGSDNQLINYRRRSMQSLTISDRDAGSIFERLVVEEQSVGIVSSKEGRKEGDISLGAPYVTADINSRLAKLSQMSCRAMDEQGYPSLFLAIGFLSWLDRSQQRLRSPILLLPVLLKQEKGVWQLCWSGHDILLSPTLVEKAKEVDLYLPELPDPQSGDAIRRHQDEIREAIKEREGFNLVNSQILDCFTFTRSVLYQDLDPANWSQDHVDSHTLLKAILRPGSVVESKMPREAGGAGNYCILDADSSQMDVLDDVVRGQSVVVEGPPGTGKSQTIANMICEFLGRGKKVLFVSEKMAALEVVKARLDHAGLSPYVLELHSEKSNRRALIREMDRCLALVQETESPDPPNPRHKSLARELDDYVQAISEPVGRRRLNPYQMVGMREEVIESFRSRGREPVQAEIKDPDFVDDEQWAEIQNTLRILQELLPQLEPVESNPWRGCPLPGMPGSKEKRVPEVVQHCLLSLERVQDSSRSLARHMGMQPPLTISDMHSFSAEVSDLLEAGSIGMANLLDERLPEYEKGIGELLEMLQDLQETKSLLMGIYRPSLLELDVTPMLEAFEKHHRSALRMMRGGFRSARNELLSQFIDEENQEDDDEVLLEHLRMLDEMRVLQGRLAAREIEASRFYGSLWKGEDSDLRRLYRALHWAVKLRENLRSGRYSDNTLIAISRAASESPLPKKLDDLEGKLLKLNESLADLHSLLGTDDRRLFHPGRGGLRPHHIRDRLREMEGGGHLLNRWAQFQRLLDNLSSGPAGSLVEIISEGRFAPEDLPDAFELGYLEGMLRIVGDSRPAWRNFSAEAQEVRRSEFSELDVASLSRNRHRLLHNLRRQAQGAHGHNLAMRALKGEINRSRGNLPVRRLMMEAGEAIQDLKPCFMMSPLSVAQFLDHRSVRFDLLIFDEASQLLPEESVGALLRSSQAAVLGDSNQLPPSTFFQSQGEVNNGPATIGDLESLLGLCRTAFPVRSLQWHYRSRHQSLMEVPNMLFYDHRLLVPPSPHRERGELGLQLRHVPSGVYERGGSGSNPKEARRIAREVRAHYRDNPDLSLAVACFSLRQRDALDAEIAKQIRRHPELATQMQANPLEPFILRNLENLQGDERDVVMISMGYGYDANDKLSLAFGPLNREGGERRLNVLMTRARYRCIIFSNFRAADMRLRPDTPLGVKHLHTFLQFAESERLFLAEPEPSNDPLVESVASFLRSRGAELDVNIGNPGYRIDIALRSPDGSCHLAAVLLDGPRYQAMPRARDRERLYDGMLHRLGWRTIRVWSQDWYMDPEGARSRLWDEVQPLLGDGFLDAAPSEEESSRDALLGVIAAKGPMHIEPLTVEYRDIVGRGRITASLREELDALLQELAAAGEMRREEDLLMLASQSQQDPIIDQDRREWRPEWVPDWQYQRLIASLPEDRQGETERLQDISDALQLRRGRLLRDHLATLFPIDTPSSQGE